MTNTDPAALQALRQMIYEMRIEQAKLRPILRDYSAKMRANMRKDGPNGFIMLRLSDLLAAPVAENDGGV